MTKLKRLKLSEWKHFENVEIDFHNRLTVLTGVNASGKTTILQKILAPHDGWNLSSYSTPIQDRVSGIIELCTNFFKGKRGGNPIIGHIEYENGQKTNIEIPHSNIHSYVPRMPHRQSVDCSFIPSHRSIFAYQHIHSVLLLEENNKDLTQEFSTLAVQRYLGNSTTSIIQSMKETLIYWLFHGYGTGEVRIENKELLENLRGFENVLKKVLPKTLAFNRLKLMGRDIIFECNDGEDQFVFEESSGGMSSLIEMVWQIYICSKNKKDNFTVIIDEVENHLHPTMQRSVLPDLLEAFPDISFIVSTHSPMVVGSVKESSVYVLTYNEDGKIISQKLDLVGQAKTATEILDEVLGVPFTMPIWAEDGLRKIIEKYSSETMTSDKFNDMREELGSLGLEKLMPEAIGDIVEKKGN